MCVARLSGGRGLVDGGEEQAKRGRQTEGDRVPVGGLFFFRPAMCFTIVCSNRHSVALCIFSLGG